MSIKISYRLIDESPRWLWGQGKKEEAIKIIQKALRINNKTMTVSLEKEQMTTLNKDDNCNNEKENTADQSYSILDLFKTPNLRQNTINVCFFW